MPEMGPWEIERDRFGVTFSGPLEVGECIKVVRADCLAGEEMLHGQTRAELDEIAAERDALSRLANEVIEAFAERPCGTRRLDAAIDALDLGMNAIEHRHALLGESDC